MAKKRAKTVRMRVFWRIHWGIRWRAQLAEEWLTSPRSYTTRRACKRSGNVWAERMGLTPKWE
jgi:hypothetical protein